MQHEHFRDFDEFAESVRGIDARMMFQTPTDRSWEIDGLRLADLQMQVGRLGSGNIAEGVSSRDTYMLYLPLTDECEYVVNGVTIPKYGFMVMEPGCEFCVSTKYEHDWCNIVIPSDMLPLLPDDEEAPEKMTCRVTRPDRQLAERFLRLVRGPLATATKHPEFESSPAAARAAADLVEVGAVVLAGPDAVPRRATLRPRVPRQTVVRRALEVLEERDRQHIAVPELAGLVGVSERTLRRAFNEYYGIGPVGYLQLRKLHQVHHALQAAELEETTVASVLFQHGVWELGRFASRYRQQFGELPSETLRAKRR